jgi:beta-phosphoglucomutase
VCAVTIFSGVPAESIPKLNQIQGVIFDLDGVITDTIRLHYQAWERLLREEGLPFSPQEYDGIRGLSREESLERVLQGRTLEPAAAQAWMKRKNRYFRDLMTQLRPEDTLPGVREWISAARRMGIAIGIGSSSRNARDVLTRLALIDAFDAIGDGYTVRNTKPAPDIFLWVAGRLNIFPAQTVVVEDGEAGILAAKTGGFKVVGVGKPEVVAQADIITPTLADLPLDTLSERL